MNKDYPNFAAISEVGNISTMAELCFADLGTQEGRQLIRRYPQCFGQDKPNPVMDLGMVIWTEKTAFDMDLNALYQKYMDEDGNFCPLSKLERDLQVPILTFASDEREAKQSNLPLIPQDVNLNTEVGQIVEIKGVRFVFLGNVECFMKYVPEQCVTIDCGHEFENRAVSFPVEFGGEGENREVSV